MKHFEADEWSDFVRGLVPDGLRQNMGAHLGAGCSSCSSMVNSLSEVQRLSVTERAAEPPSDLVEAAFAVFPEPVPVSGLTLPKLLARLLSDSAAMPLPVGFRTALSPPRHVVYQARDLLLEIRVQERIDQTKSTLAGMIGLQETPGSPQDHFHVDRLPVYLLSRKKILAQTISNQFGEFLLEFEPRKDLRLCLPLAQAGGRIDISLGRLLDRRKAIG